jgi:CBS domain-containing protein
MVAGPFSGGDAMRVREAMTHRAETIGPDETLEAAARAMKQLDVGALLVRGDEGVVGILTDRDIVVRAVAEGRSPAEATVRGAMTPQVIECSEDDDLERAATRMAQGAVRRLAVVDASRELVGVLSIDDVALHSPALAGAIVEHARAPERPIARGPWPWWESPET